MLPYKATTRCKLPLALHRRRRSHGSVSERNGKINIPTALMFLHPNKWIQEEGICRDKQYREQRLEVENVHCKHTSTHEYATRVLAHFMFLSLSLLPLLRFDSWMLLNLFIFFLFPSLSPSCMRPSSLISRGPIILRWPPHLLPTGALEGQKILMLTDVNLHDFLASISTTVVCLLRL